MTPTQRTLAELRKRGYHAQVVERHNTFSRKKHDLFGCIDIVAVHPAYGILGVQACAGASHAARRSKIAALLLADDNAAIGAWLHHARLSVWSWSRRKVKRGGKAMRWVVREEAIE